MGEPGLVESDGVEVALDHDQLAGRGRRLARRVQAEEERPLVIERGLGRVEILGRIVGRQSARPESHHRAAGGDERHHEPVAEAVVEAATRAAAWALCAPHREAGLHQRVGVELAPQALDQVLPARRGEAEPKRAHALARHPTPLEVGARLGAALRIAEPLLVGARRQIERLDQPAAASRLARRAAALRHRDAGPPAQQLDRLEEAHLLGLLHVLEDVPSRLAAEAVVELPFRVHRERRRLLLVEWAQPDHVVPHLAQPHGLAHQLDQIGGGAHPLDPVLARAATRATRPPRVHRSLATVAPRPPSPAAPRRCEATCGWPRRWRSTTARRMPRPMPCTMRSSENEPSTARSSA